MDREQAREKWLLPFLFVMFWVLLGVFLVVMFLFEWGPVGAASSRLFGISNAGQHDAKHQILKFLGLAMGGMLVALQAFASYKRSRTLEDTVKAQVEANRHTELGQRHERLKNAVDHLGHASDSVRLGGAYELFHLAADNEELRQTVLDILCAHIRRTTSETSYRERHAASPSEEVQSLLTLLFVDDHQQFADLRINLQGSWLNGADIAEARFPKALLLGAHLEGARLRFAQLQEADLSHACLRKAMLLGAWLEGASLIEADVREAELASVDLQGATLLRANLRDADLHGATLHGTDFLAADLQGAQLHGTSMEKAGFMMADLRGVDLGGMRLRRTDFHGAKLQGANLQGAQLMEACLDKASLAGADLRNACLPEASLLEADLRGADLSGACLYGAKLRRARLQGAELRMGSLQGADLAGAGLQGADLRDGFLQGANFFDTHLQGACLGGAQLHGARGERERPLHEQVITDSLFRDRIRNRIGCQGDLSGATFEGGLAPADLEAFLDDLPVEKASRLRERLEAHVDMPAGHEPPGDSGAVGGAYGAAEAEQWIAEYQDAMSEMPGTGRWGG